MEHREDHNEIPEFTLEDILAEFGSGSDLYRTEDLPAEENSPETAPAEAPAQQEAPAEPEPHAEPETSAAAELPRKPEGLRFTPGADPVDMDFPAEVLEEVFSSGGPLLPEEDQPSETQIIHFPHQPVPEEDGKPAAETTATEASSEENAPEEEPAEEPQETPELQEAPKVSLEQIMNDTVSSVLEEQEDGILEERPPLREVLRHWWEKLTRPRTAAPIPQDTETLWEQPQEPQPEPEPDPEPDMDVAVRAEKRRCARLKRQCWCVLPEAVLLTVLSVLDGLGLYIPRLWAALPCCGGSSPADCCCWHWPCRAGSGAAPVSSCPSAASPARRRRCWHRWCVWGTASTPPWATGSSCRWRPSRSSPCCCACGASCWRPKPGSQASGWPIWGVSRPTTYP